MKKIFSILLIAVMMISTLSVNIYAEKDGESTTTPSKPIVEDETLVTDGAKELSPNDLEIGRAHV